MANYKVVWNRPFDKNSYPNETVLEAKDAREAAILTARSVPDPIWCRLMFVINWDTQTIEWQIGDDGPLWTTNFAIA